jgi:FMN phosphatase YigB (HAD superfamily)
MRSFDVFDTAITRPWFRPADLFYAVAVEARHHGLWHGEFATFRALRIKAEQQARQRSAVEEVSLADIYEVLAGTLGWTAEQTRSMAAIERAVELESCLPIAQIRDEMTALAARDATLLFISDSYLDAATITRMLDQSGFPAASSRLFVSCEHGKTKWTGRLFGEVLAALEVPPHCLQHRGDNPMSDVRVPRRLGIDATPFRAGSENHYEAAFAGLRPDVPVLTSAIAGSARAVRLSRHFESVRQRTIWATAADVSGPLLSGYVLWLLARAVARGQRRLYFFARDGQILKQIAERFVQWYGLDIELRYLYVSRRALFLAALDGIDAAALEWFVEDGAGKTLADILARIDLDFAQVAAVAARMGCSLSAAQRLSHDDLRTVASILADKAVEPAIMAAAQRRRALVIAYLQQEGLLDGTPFAIVDIGWRGRLQRALHTILVGGGLLDAADLVGYYLGMFTPLAAMPWGVIETCLSAGKSYYASLIEFFTAADHGSTLGYARVGARIEPVLDHAPDAASRADIVLQQEGITAFAATLLRALRRPICDPAELADAVVAAGAGALERMVYRPSTEEAEIFGGVQHSPDQAHLGAQEIAPRVGLGPVLLAVLGHLGPLRRAGDWPTASLRRSLRSEAVASLGLELLELRRRLALLTRRLHHARAGGGNSARIATSRAAASPGSASRSAV